MKIKIILAVTIVISTILFLNEVIFRESETVILRNGYGEGKKVVEYEVFVEEEGEGLMQIEVEEKEYTSEEIRDVFREISKRLDKLILGQNKSFDRVEKDLNLVTKIEGYPVQISWQMDSYSVLNVYGEIQEENLKEEGTLVELRGTISYKEEEFIYVQYVTVYPLTRTGTEKILYEIQQKVKETEEKTRNKNQISLPQSIDGKKVSWRLREGSRWYITLFLGVMVCVYLVYKEKETERKKIKRRKDELMRTYPGMISNFTMLLGAGITVRNVWEKMVQNYEKQKDEMGCFVVYEEMAITLRELQGGISEAEAYERFGKRCGLNLYVKFAALLAQNLRKGSRGMSELLKMEAFQAFENRKNIAKRMGEEAGTKLLMPMVGMLAVVFIMVMIPAFLSMQS